MHDFRWVNGHFLDTCQASSVNVSGKIRVRKATYAFTYPDSRLYRYLMSLNKKGHLKIDCMFECGRDAVLKVESEFCK
jgi:hypothetical protein